jgi:hypothetical protein
MAIANSLLSKNKKNKLFDKDEFDKAILLVKNSKISFNTGAVKMERIKLRFDGRDSHKKMAELLGDKSLFLYHKTIHTKTGNKYLIEFNVDGEGKTKLPDGTIEDINLHTLSKRISDELDVHHYQGGAGYQWYLCHENEPDAEKKISKNRLGVYLDKIAMEKNL